MSSSHLLIRRVTRGLVCFTSSTWPTTSVLHHCSTVRSCSVRASASLLSVFHPHRKRGERTGYHRMASLLCIGRKMEPSTRSLMECGLRTIISPLINWIQRKGGPRFVATFHVYLLAIDFNDSSALLWERSDHIQGKCGTRFVHSRWQLSLASWAIFQLHITDQYSFRKVV